MKNKVYILILDLLTNCQRKAQSASPLTENKALADKIRIGLQKLDLNSRVLERAK